MAQIDAKLVVRRRWFFWPAAVVIVCLGRLRVLRDVNRAAQWLVDHAMRLEVR